VKRYTVAEILKTNHQLNAFKDVTSLEDLTPIVAAEEEVETREGRDGYLLSCRNRVLLLLIKPKLNLTFRCLSALFDRSATTCKTFFADMTARLGKIMKHVLRRGRLSLRS